MDGWIEIINPYAGIALQSSQKDRMAGIHIANSKTLMQRLTKCGQHTCRWTDRQTASNSSRTTRPVDNSARGQLGLYVPDNSARRYNLY